MSIQKSKIYEDFEPMYRCEACNAPKITRLAICAKCEAADLQRRKAEAFTELVPLVRALLRELAHECTCHEGYKLRNLTDPDCRYCDYAGTLEPVEAAMAKEARNER